MKTICVIIIVLLLTGCGYTPPTMSLVDANNNMLLAEQECYKSLMNLDGLKTEGLTSQELMFFVQNQNMMRTMMVVAGKNPCKSGANINDVMINEMESKNKVLSTVVGTTGKVVSLGLGIWGAAEIVDSITSQKSLSIDTGGGDADLTNSGNLSEISHNTGSTVSSNVQKVKKVEPEPEVETEATE